MINIDYLIRRNEGDEEKEYVPDQIPSELPQLAYIRGPNSSGKSTLLNIIALGLFGRKLSRDELNDNLRKKIDTLINSSHQKIKFDFEIENELMGVKILSKKENLNTKDFIVKITEGDNSSIISPDKFKDRFRLIYDIPNDPLERLPLLLRNVRNNQDEVASNIENFREYLRDVRDEISDAKDPEAIEKLKERLKEFIQNLEDKKREIENIRVTLCRVREYFYARFLHINQEEKTAIEEKISSIKKEDRRIEREQNKAYDKLQELEKKLQKKISEAEEIIRDVKSILPKVIEGDQQKKYKHWENAVLRDEIYYSEINNAIRSKSKYFRDYLGDLYITEQEKSSQDLEMVNLIKSLLSSVIEYRNHKLNVPVVDLPINEFIDTLKDSLEEYEGITTKLDNVDHCKNQLDDLVIILDDAIKHRKRKVDVEGELTDDEKEELSVDSKITEFKSNLDVVNKKIEMLQKEAIKADLDPGHLVGIYKELRTNEDLEPYEFFKEDDLRKKISKLEEKIADREKRKDKLEIIIGETKENIKQLESKEPHKYQDQFDIIQNILAIVKSLEQSFVSFEYSIDKIMDDSVDYSDLSENEMRYTENIGNYLAKKIGQIRHIDKFYDVKNIDVVSEKIESIDGKEIRFSDLGTGQGQAAYLNTRLSMSDDKKIIALFDEVAMMDENSLQPIKEKLIQLYKEKKLLMAIIVQKGEKVEVDSLI